MQFQVLRGVVGLCVSPTLPRAYLVGVARGVSASVKAGAVGGVRYFVPRPVDGGVREVRPVVGVRLARPGMRPANDPVILAQSRSSIATDCRRAATMDAMMGR